MLLYPKPSCLWQNFSALIVVRIWRLFLARELWLEPTTSAHLTLIGDLDGRQKHNASHVSALKSVENSIDKL